MPAPIPGGTHTGHHQTYINGFTVATQNALNVISIGKVIYTLYTSVLKCGLKSIQFSATNLVMVPNLQILI